MQDFVESQHGAEPQYNRRATDRDETGKPITIRDTWDRAGLAHARLNEHISEHKLSAQALEKLQADIEHIKRAFVRDDLGGPDYEGHRQDHRARIEAAKVVGAYKFEATKKLIMALVIFLAGAMGTGLLGWLKEHMK